MSYKKQRNTFKKPAAIALIAALTVFSSGCGNTPSGSSSAASVSSSSEADVVTYSSSSSSSSSVAAVISSSSSSVAAVVELDGKVLFADNCASCHTAADLGAGKSGGDISNKSADSISRHIGSVAAMNGLDWLTDEQLDALEGVMVKKAEEKPALDGAALYEANCTGCHGGGKKGKSASAISNAINSNAGGMGKLSSLTAEEIQAISEAK